EDMGSVSCVGRPYLLSIDDDLISLEFGLGPQAGQIRPRARLGIAFTPNVVTLQDTRQIICYLLIGTPGHQRRPELRFTRIDDPPHPGSLHFLLIDELLGKRKSHATVLLRPGRGTPAMLIELAQPINEFIAP